MNDKQNCQLKIETNNKLKIKKIPVIQVINKLDSFLNRNDLEGAKKYLVYWHNEALMLNDNEGLVSILNEQMGLFRKLNLEKEAFNALDEVKEILIKLNANDRDVFVGTTYLNMGTVYKAFNKPTKALTLYKMAKTIYEKFLPKNDKRMAGLYNNMALALVDNNELDIALSYYHLAISILNADERGFMDQAITHLNIANLYEKKYGLLDGNQKIEQELEIAMVLLDQNILENDGYYAFVCDKCSSTFSYYGYFMYASILKERARKIYERN